MFLRNDSENAQNPLGKTAFYDPNNVSVTLYTTDRHIKDVMRSLAHELVHHAQHERGEFENCGEMGEGYAQNDEHLREMEREAYEVGNMCFRDWEDGIKNTIYFEHLNKGEQKKMSIKNWKNKEIKSLLSEAWGFKMNLDKLIEEGQTSGTKPRNDPHAMPSCEEMPWLCPDDKEKEGKADSKREEEGMDEYARAPGGGMGKQGRGRKYRDMAGGEMKPERSKYATMSSDPASGKTQTPDPDPNAFVDVEDEEMEESKLQEDSGEEEGRHYKDNEMNDDDHIKAIEHHLAALKKDHDYDDEHIDEEKVAERRRKGRKGPHIRGTPDPHLRPEQRVRSIIRKALEEAAKAKLNKE